MGGDAEADKELCVRAMGAIYSVHAAAVGVLTASDLPCETPHVVIVVRFSPGAFMHRCQPH